MDEFEILLIEDSIDDRLFFGMAVKASRIPATVVYSYSAADAVSRLNRLGVYGDTPLPHLIVLDLCLPGITGKTLLQVIRNAYGPQLVPVVVLTGSDMPVDKAECESWAINAYLVKPNTFPGLVELVSLFPMLLNGPSPERISRMLKALSGPH